MLKSLADQVHPLAWEENSHCLFEQYNRPALYSGFIFPAGVARLPLDAGSPALFQFPLPPLSPLDRRNILLENRCGVVEHIECSRVLTGFVARPFPGRKIFQVQYPNLPIIFFANDDESSFRSVGKASKKAERGARWSS